MNEFETKQESKEIAIAISKRKYCNMCIKSNQPNPDGAHIFCCSLYPELRNYPCNIVPLSRWFHSHRKNKNCMDFVGNSDRTPHERIKWLMENITDPNNRAELKVQLITLDRVLKTERVRIDFDILEYVL